MEKHSSKKSVLLRKGSSSESLHQVTFTSGNPQLSRFCPSLCWLQKSISLRFQKWWCLSILIHVHKAHKRLTDKPQSLWIHFQWKICQSDSLDTCSIQLDQHIHISLVNKYFLKSQVWVPYRQIKPNERQVVGWACQSKDSPDASGLRYSLSRQVFSHLLHHHHPSPRCYQPSPGQTRNTSCYFPSFRFLPSNLLSTKCPE